MSHYKTYYIVSLFHNILLNDNNQTNVTNNDTLPFTSEENKNEGYLYLLLFDLIIFGSLTYTTYTSSKKLQSENLPPDDFRINFIKWLVLANGIRTLSLIFILIINNPNGNNGISWINSFLHVAPAFIFVSSYMYLATFFAHIYYSSIDYYNHLLRPALTMIVNGGYVFLGLIGIITLFIGKYKIFFYISELLMAILYLVLGSVIIYFGKKVSEIIESKSQNNFDSNDRNNKFGLMSLSIGSLFLIKGVSGVLGGISAYDPKNHNIYDFFWFLILEVLPTVIFIRTAKTNASNGNNNIETPRSSINDFELGSQRETSYRPPFQKDE